MDKIILEGVTFSCNIGVTDEERSNKQPIIFDFMFFCDTQKSAQTDDLSDTIDYRDIHALVKKLVEDHEYNLIERMANVVADAIVANFPLEKVVVRLHKPEAMQSRNTKDVILEITREKNGKVTNA